MSSSKFNASRRRMLTASTLLVAPLLAHAQDAFSPQMGQSGNETQAGVVPYRLITAQAPFRHAVVEIMEWNCPYCRQVNDGAIEWGKSLPKPWVFVQIPVITDVKSLRAAALFAAIQQVAGSRLAAFGDAVFSAVQDHGEDPNDPRTLMTAADSSGISYSAFSKGNTGDAVRKTVSEWLSLEQVARPKLTPTFIVAGKMVTDSSMTAGRYDLLFQLLSGLVSQSISAGH